MGTIICSNVYSVLGNMYTRNCILDVQNIVFAPKNLEIKLRKKIFIKTHVMQAECW